MFSVLPQLGRRKRVGELTLGNAQGLEHAVDEEDALEAAPEGLGLLVVGAVREWRRVPKDVVEVLVVEHDGWASVGVVVWEVSLDRDVEVGPELVLELSKLKHLFQPEIMGS